MIGKRISDLDPAPLPLSSAAVLPVVQDGTTAKMTLEQVRGGRVVSVRDFGAVGDGVADDTAAFRAMHAQLFADQRQTPGMRSVITVPPGHYRYTWNRWTWGLRDVTVDGRGAVLQCVSASEWNLGKFPLVTNRNGFQVLGLDDEAQPRDLNSGCLIETALPGTATLRLKTPAEAARFPAGRHVLVMSYDQQFAGYPPNCRYFDYAVVADSGKGTVTLDRPVRHAHRDDYPEIGDSSMGAARLVDIDRDDVPFAQRQVLLGLTFLPNPNIDDPLAQYVLAQGVQSFMARDCTLPSFVGSIGQDFLLENTTLAFSEPDKLVESMTFMGCRIGALTQATGVNRLHARNCTFATKASAQARIVTFDGCTFNGAAQPGDYKRGVDLVGFAPTGTVNILNSVFYGKNNDTDAAVGPVGTPSNGVTSVTLEAPLSIVANRALVIPKTDKRAATLLRSLEPGDVLWVGGQAGGEVIGDGRYGRVIGVANGPAAVTLEIAFSAPVTPRDTLIVPRVQRLRCMGNTYNALPVSAPVTPDTTWESNVERSERYTFRLRSDFTEVTQSVTGYLRSLSVRVLRPYTGADETLCLRIEQRYPANPDFLPVIDLRQAGERRVTVRGTSGVRQGDALPPPRPDQFLWALRFSHSKTANGRSITPAGDAHDHAETIVVLETDNPFALTG